MTYFQILFDNNELTSVLEEIYFLSWKYIFSALLNDSQFLKYILKYRRH
jgi:hypothetical protein